MKPNESTHTIAAREVTETTEAVNVPESAHKAAAREAHERYMEAWRQRDRATMAQCVAFAPILREYMYPNTFDLGDGAVRNHQPTAFVGEPFNAPNPEAMMVYCQGAAFARWDWEDTRLDGWGDAHNPLMMWMRRLYETSNHYALKLCQWHWEYHLGTLWAASALAPLLSSWGLSFRRDAQHNCLMLDFAIGPNEVLSTPAHYVARAMVEHAKNTGELGNMKAALLCFLEKTKRKNRLAYYETLVRLLESHGEHDAARPLAYYLRPDIQYCSPTDELVPIPNADQWVNHEAMVKAYEERWERPAPQPKTVADLYAMIREYPDGMRRGYLTEWWWYSIWRYGYSLDWGSIVYITNDLPHNHPLHGIWEWHKQFREGAQANES